MSCENCKDWGRTMEPGQAPIIIHCSKCGRATYPNLGVNCPAGSAVSFGSFNMRKMLAEVEIVDNDGRRLPLLPAYADRELSAEGQQQLVDMMEDQNMPTPVGMDLPEANREVLLRKRDEERRDRAVRLERCLGLLTWHISCLKGEQDDLTGLGSWAIFCNALEDAEDCKVIPKDLYHYLQEKANRPAQN